MNDSKIISMPYYPRQSLTRASVCGVVWALITIAVGFPQTSIGRISSDNSNVPLADLIRNLREENDLVGLAAMVMVDGKLVESAVAGERKTGSGVQLEIGDRFHLGSITKSITATMIGQLVESGQMKWSDTVGEYYPDATIHDDWKPVTIRQLLTHSSGSPRNFSIWVKLQHPELGVACTQARRKAVLEIMANKPENPPGETYTYSNVGFTIAGAMAEEVTGVAWKDLVRREVFEPLKLTTAGFGPPKSTDKKIEQPRGHRQLFGWKVAADDDDDNTPIIGPAGTVHMSLNDLCTFASEHLNGAHGVGRLLNTETYKQLHAPELANYACGWVKREKNAEIPHTIYWHSGANTMWYALVVFVPDKKLVIAVASNDCNADEAETAAWEIISSYIPTGVYPKRSPFRAVRWHESQPEFKLGSEWFGLVSLNDIGVSKIVSFSQQTFGEKWRKRFEEDLVELLTRMGHKPRKDITLVVKSLMTGKESVREQVPMTESNRQAIRAAAATQK